MRVWVCVCVFPAAGLLCGLPSCGATFCFRLNSKPRTDGSKVSSMMLSPTTAWHNGDHTQRSRNGKTGKLNHTEGEKSHDVCSPLYFAPIHPSHRYTHTCRCLHSRLRVGWHEFTSLSKRNIPFVIVSVVLKLFLTCNRRSCEASLLHLFFFFWLLFDSSILAFSFFRCSLVKKGERE